MTAGYSTARSMVIKQLSEKERWDMIVVGGGASGLGIALEGVSRGYSVLVVEQHDFAKGTSSRSTKLIHGGVRYLAQGNIRLVREASLEREILLRNAPHLVRNCEFVIPLYSTWQRFTYTVGLKIYDWIAWRSGSGASHFISTDETMQKLPGINTRQLSGGVLYHDGQFDDSRLAINLVQTIFEGGGIAANYMQVVGLLKNEQGFTEGVNIMDVENGDRYSCKARVVINATGVFADNILQMDAPDAEQSLTVSQGVHLVFDKRLLPTPSALMIPSTSDGRVLFAVPWHNKVIAGTTDTPLNEISLEPRPLESEVQFVLDNLARYLTVKPTRNEVLSVFAGLRPLAASGNGKQTKEMSRSHRIIVSASRLFSMLGGKWTTYRKMGEDMVNRIEKELRWPVTKSVSRSMQIHGAMANSDDTDPLYFYGSDGKNVVQLMNSFPNGWLSERIPVHIAQVVWAVQNEMARTVEDVLSRRTRALLLDARESIRIAPAVAEMMADMLGYDKHWVDSQIDEYNRLASGYILN